MKHFIIKDSYGNELITIEADRYTIENGFFNFYTRTRECRPLELVFTINPKPGYHVIDTSILTIKEISIGKKELPHSNIPYPERVNRR